MTDAPERIWVQKSAANNWDDPIATPYRVQHFHEYIRKDLAKPKVKPLEWVYSRAESEVGTYVIDSGLSSGVEGRGYAWAHDPDESDSFYIWQYGVRVGSEEAAKAAAQTDYEQRILSALENNT